MPLFRVNSFLVIGEESRPVSLLIAGFLVDRVGSGGTSNQVIHEITAARAFIQVVFLNPEGEGSLWMGRMEWLQN